MRPSRRSVVRRATADVALSRFSLVPHGVPMSDGRGTTMAVYGTLRRGQRNHRLLEDAEYLGEGFVRGALYAVAAASGRSYPYPALVRSRAGRTAVEVYRVVDDETLRRIDALEGYDPAHEASSEYVRRIIPVQAGPVDRAHVYVFRGTPADLGERIAGGDWVAHASA